MIRVLLMIAAAGFVLSVGAFAAAIAIGGPDAIARGGWRIAEGDMRPGFYGWDGHQWGWHDGRDDRAHGPRATRTLAWDGSESLDVNIPAEVTYVQSDGPGSVELSGPASMVDRVVLRNGRLEFDDRGERWWRRKLDVTVRAPKIHAFDLSGASELKLDGYRQPKLELHVSGAGKVEGSGEVDTLELRISGAGDVDLGDLRAKGADVSISGAGDAEVAPTEWAKLAISGMGDIKLKTRPPRMETDISGAGRIHHPDGDDDLESAAPPEPAEPPEPPQPGKRT